MVDLLNLLNADKPEKFEWIKRRIQQMWPHWQTAFASLKTGRDLGGTIRKKVCLQVNTVYLWLNFPTETLVLDGQLKGRHSFFHSVETAI